MNFWTDGLYGRQQVGNHENKLWMKLQKLEIIHSYIICIITTATLSQCFFRQFQIWILTFPLLPGTFSERLPTLILLFEISLWLKVFPLILTEEMFHFLMSLIKHKMLSFTHEVLH